MTNRTPNHTQPQLPHAQLHHQTTTIMANTTATTTTTMTTTTTKLLEPNAYTQQSRRPLSRRKRRRRQPDDVHQQVDATVVATAAANEHVTACHCETAAGEPSIRTPASREPPPAVTSWCSELPNPTRFLPKLLDILTRSSAATSLPLSSSASSSSSSSLGYMTYLLLVLTAAVTCCMGQPPCESHSWWDPVRDKCIPCTLCQEEMIPLRPCQQHRDTICGSIYDLKIDWVVLAKTEPNWKERRKSDDHEHFDQLQQLQQQHLTHEQIQQLQDEGMALDWQTGALFVAVLACLLFFIVAACILVHHMRQWRRMERRLDQDVEELSTKLMAKLVEVQSLEGGTFFIGNADALRVPSGAAMSSSSSSAAAGPTATQSSMFQTQYVLLPEKPTKHHDRRIIKNQQPGNVYIEESSSKG